MTTLEQAVVQSAHHPTDRLIYRESVVSRVLKLLCSVKFGVFLIVLLAFTCLLGMIVMQQNVAGFERYFAMLTPAERMVYGQLGLFDIYHSWYFNALLCLLSLNIVLASIDRFPKTWLFVSRPQVIVPIRWLRDQKNVIEFTSSATVDRLSAQISDALVSTGWGRPLITEKGQRRLVFGQSGLWNRFGAYGVHIALLTVFFGGFMTGQLGSSGQMAVSPGQKSDHMFETVVQADKATEITKQLPFTITGVDLEQKLLHKGGALDAANTIDWITRVTVSDETGTHQGTIRMNQPFDYRGYRFFHSGFLPVGRARSVTLKMIAGNGSPMSITVPRDGAINLSDGTSIELVGFRGNFRVDEEDLDEITSKYPNPAAILRVKPQRGEAETAYAFRPEVDNLPVSTRTLSGYEFQLIDYEKVADQHFLTIQRDPGAGVVYVGFGLLSLTLGAVFLFSHQRIWVVIEPVEDGTQNVIIAANTNRNAIGFDKKFRRFRLAIEQKLHE